jgi:hypothetical protein
MEGEPLRKLIEVICTFVRSLWRRNPTATEILLSDSLRCSECGTEIREGNGFFIDCWFCGKCWEDIPF